MEMKETPSIFIFMHDSFPHKELADYLKLEHYDDLIDCFKTNGFVIYDVYSLYPLTHFTMPSVFNMQKELEKKIDSHAFTGDTKTNFLLQKNGYKTGMVLHGHWVNLFRDLNYFYDFSIDSQNNIANKTDVINKAINDKKYSNYVLLSIAKGFLNSVLLEDFFESSGAGYLLDFIEKMPDKDKIFAWQQLGPSHSADGALSCEEELSRWIPKYNSNVEQMKNEIELTLKANPNAIIIFMSDHGPRMLEDNITNYPTLSEDEITAIHFRDNFGAFMAVYWPDKEKAAKYDNSFYVSQDLFSIVFSYIYDSPEPLKYKIKDTSIRLKDHKFDKGIFYPYFYKKEKTGEKE
jgi:hypothetical protein